jgi:hypothetical protein
MANKKFPEDSSGEVIGPDYQPMRRTRAHVVHGFVEPVESRWYERRVGAGGINFNGDRATDNDVDW